MIRGHRLFICDDCKKVFWGSDVEYNCMVFLFLFLARGVENHTLYLFWNYRIGLSINRYGRILRKVMMIKTKNECLFCRLKQYKDYEVYS